MPEVEQRAGASTADQVLSEFDARKDDLAKLSAATRQLIETILEVKKLPYQSVQARVKDREKLKTKYCNPKKDYKSLDEMPDVVGLRIITYYSDTIDHLAAIVGQEFTECGLREDKRVIEPDSFGYSAIHMDCSYSPERLKTTEYRRFSGLRFEIQITTVIGHAWAEMQHPWYDELNSPTEELRRFHRLAAVLELAEQEFLEVRKKKDERARTASVRVEAKAPGTPITTESLAAFIRQDDLVTELDVGLEPILGNTTPVEPDSYTLNILVRWTIGVGIPTIQRLEDELNKNSELIMEFAARCKPIWDAVGPDSGSTYIRGLCIFHLANMLAGGLGIERYQALAAEAGIHFHSDLNISEQIVIAKEIIAQSR
jgi:ppGpp synthetase/RelA/SpoT-type nucleotidyltranferase